MALPAPTRLPSETQRAATVPEASAVRVWVFWLRSLAEPRALTPFTLAVAAWAAVRPPALGTAMVTERTSIFPSLRVSVPETERTAPVSFS